MLAYFLGSLLSEGLIIGRSFASEIWGLIFGRAYLVGGGAGGGAYYGNFTVLDTFSKKASGFMIRFQRNAFLPS